MGNYDLQGEYKGSLLQNFEFDNSKQDESIQAQAENIYDCKQNTLCDNNGRRNTWNCFRRETASCDVHAVVRKIVHAAKQVESCDGCCYDGVVICFMMSCNM